MLGSALTVLERMENDKLKLIFGQLADARSSARAEQLLAGFIEDYSDILAVRIGYYLRGRDDLVDEVLWDVFMDVWRKGSGLAELPNPAGWLMIVCRNRAVSVLRSEDRHTLGGARLLDEWGSLEADETLFSQVIYSDYVAIIEKCLESLPEQQRKVFVMRKFQEMSIKGIANTLDIAEPTVKRHLQLACGRLRELFAQIRKEDLE